MNCEPNLKKMKKGQYLGDSCFTRGYDSLFGLTRNIIGGQDLGDFFQKIIFHHFWHMSLLIKKKKKYISSSITEIIKGVSDVVTRPISSQNVKS